MKATDFNNLSDKMVRKLKPDERAVYRILNVQPDPDNYGKYLMPAAVQIRPTDEVLDKGTNEFVNIAAIERTDIDGNPTFLSIVFSSNNMGYLFLQGNNPVHQKIYQFLEICNYNKSNPNRREDIEPVFERIDAKKDAMEERAMRKLIVTAVNKAVELDDKKARETALALGIESETIEETRNLLEDYAGDNPQEFLDVVERASLENEKMLKDAIKSGIIRNNLSSQVFEWAETGKEIYRYKKAPNKNYIKELADYLEENNPEELKAIQTRLG